MNEIPLVIRPRDPLLVRDGRPFSADPGALAETLPWPLPSTLAGAIRTYIGHTRKYTWTREEAEAALAIGVHGPLVLACNDGVKWQPYFPAPADALCYRDEEGVIKAERLAPWFTLPVGAGCNLPDDTWRPLYVPREVKPCGGMEWWSLDDIANWLGGMNVKAPQDTLARLPIEARTHVKIKTETGTHETGKLFSTLSLCFNDIRLTPRTDRKTFPLTAMLCRVLTDVVPALFTNGALPLGGERRVSLMEDAHAVGGWPAIPQALCEALTGTQRLKLQLVTPAIFTNGWQPGWLASGEIPGLSNLKVTKLVSAAVARRTPVSGWNMTATARHQKVGPKAARFMAPMGSVYFVELERALTAQDIAKLWLHPISDDAQDCRDGFGLAIPGVWNYAFEGDD